MTRLLRSLTLIGALGALGAARLAAQSVQARLAGRIPSGAVPAVDSLVEVARQETLPTEPLVQKALEGGAKQVPAPRIVAAVQTSLGQLRDARDLLVQAGDHAPPQPAEVTTVAWAMRRRLPAPVVERLVAALPQPPRAAALHAVADLVAHRFDADSATDLIIDAIHQGLQGERLLDVSTAAVHALQRGQTRLEAIAIVRQQLPNVPAAPKPTRGAVARARRPGAPVSP
ncbi:MAG TPA: hypothetical protein VJN39_05900 [Gemmatimonadales bacterium]|nr:hypothetical protein [Gemmatimonadales bacterium]